MQSFNKNQVPKYRNLSIEHQPGETPTGKRMFKLIKSGAKIKKGDISYRIAPKFFSEFFLLQHCDPKELKRIIMKDVGTRPDNEKAMLRTIFGILDDNYYRSGRKRASGADELKHPYLAGAVAAETGASFKGIAGSLLHDIKEHIRDEGLKFIVNGKRSIKVNRKNATEEYFSQAGVGFPEDIIVGIALLKKGGKIAFAAKDNTRWTANRTDGQVIVQSNGRVPIFSLDGILAYFRKTFRPHGKQIVAGINDATRDRGEGSKQKGPTWMHEYAGYLARVNRTLVGHNLKFGDLIANLIERATVEKSLRAVAKAALDMPYLVKSSYVYASMLRAAIRISAKGGQLAGIEKLLDWVPESEIDKFERGWAKSGKHQYSLDLLKTITVSGSNTINVYEVAPSKYRIEMPVKKSDFGLLLIKASRAAIKTINPNIGSLLPRYTRTTSFADITFRKTPAENGQEWIAAEEQLKTFMGKLVAEFDVFIRKKLIPDFDRRKWAQAARMKNSEIERQNMTPEARAVFEEFLSVWKSLSR